MDRVVRRPWERIRVQFECVGESMTEQSQAAATDINYIVSRYQRTGVFPPSDREPYYGDVTRLQEDLRSRMEFSEATIQAFGEFIEARQAESASAIPASSTASPGEAVVSAPS